MPRWTPEAIHAYQLFAKTFIADYDKEIDCADLALASLIEYAYPQKLRVKLKFYDHGWKSYDSNDHPDMAEFEAMIRQNMGALNVIDNTVAIKLAQAGAGDLIMTRWDAHLGHTRIIHDITPVDPTMPATTDYDVVWYQGNLPAVVPQRREQLFSTIGNVYGESPRRWHFDAFDR